MTKQDINWAKGHDWYLTTVVCTNGNLMIVVHEQGQDHCESFDNLTELRNWAGY